MESRLEVQTDQLPSGECMLNVFLKCMLGLLWFLFCIFIKVLVTLFYIGGTESRDMLTQMAQSKF